MKVKYYQFMGRTNNMNNNKTIKTTLFASLIVALILPVSGMPFAQAQEQTTEEKLAQLQEYREQIQNETTKKNSEENNIVIERLDILEEMLTVKMLSEEGTLNQAYSAKYTSFLLKQIEATFDDDAISLSAAATQSFLTITPYQTSTQTNFNCDDVQNDIGYNWGSITGIDFIESYVVNVQGYPDHIDHLDTWCTERTFDSGYTVTRNISTGQACTSNFTSANDADNGYCAKFGFGAPVLITANAWYDGPEIFNITEGWDFIWVAGP
jgi:hypothetical protein